MNLFAPHNNSGAIPNTKLIKYLARQDVRITLVTKAVTPDMVIDEALLPVEMDRIRTIRVDHSQLFRRTMEASRNRITDNGVKLKMKSETRPLRSKVVNILKNTYLTTRDRDWFLRATAAMKRELAGEHFDCVYSTFPNEVNHVLARWVMGQGMADRWIADFRDPMFYQYHDAHNLRRLKRQHRIEREADLVTIVSEGARSKFRCDGVAEEKLICIPNGFDPEDAAQTVGTPTDGMLRIFYAGTLYAGRRDFSVVFRAISELNREGLVEPERIRFEYAGNEWPVMRSFAEQYGLTDCCINHGFIPRSRVLELLGEADCTAVCTHNTKTDQGVVTGKVFELLLVGKPIVTVVNGDTADSELAAIVRDCHAGPVYEQPTHDRDYPALKQWLLDTYREKLETLAVAPVLDPGKRDAYSYEALSGKLFELIAR
ncbi:MAG: glycosyltransferase [Oscillospiraceae bacterium]|nr:glycosyltransferase [Oscillospiraceae bacterium]